MQIVIDIPKEDWEFIKESDGCRWSRTIIEGVINGKPLPEHHGRLIDADSIYQIVRPIEQSDANWGMTAETAKRIIYDVFNKADTIIEADKERGR